MTAGTICPSCAERMAATGNARATGAVPWKARSTSSPVIRMEGLGKRYPMGEGEVRALENVDFAVQEGEFVAIVGPSGSGKSTLMNIIGLLDVPDDGTYWLNGLDVAELADNALADLRNRTIGFVFQNFNLLGSLTVLSRHEAARGQRLRPPLPGESRSRGTRAASSAPALGRTAAARGHRPRAGGQPFHLAGRRAHRSAGLAHEHRDHGAVRGLAPRRADRRPHHPQPELGSPGRAYGEHRRRTAAGRQGLRLEDGS